MTGWAASELQFADLVRLMGVANSTIRRWERGEAEPTMTVAQMKAFCKAVNKTLDELPDSLIPLSKSEEDEGK